MKFRLWAKLGDMSGQSLVELAFALPLLVILALGIFDFSRAIQANNIITNMSREGANLASRTSVAPLDIMNSLASTAKPLSMSDHGAIYITQVTMVGGVPTITGNSWRVIAGDLSSRVTQANVAKKLGSIPVPTDDTVYICEVIYTYDFLFKAYSPTLYSITIL